MLASNILFVGVLDLAVLPVLGHGTFSTIDTGANSL